MRKSEHVYISLEISPKMDDRLHEIAARLGADRGEVLRKAIALIDIAVRAKAEGLRIALVGADEAPATEIVGL